MTNNKFVYLNTRAALQITGTGGSNLGNCYNAMTFRVTSKKPLDLVALRAMRDLGFLGYGQEFYAHLVAPDGKRVALPPKGDQPPTGTDTVQCSEVNPQGMIVACPATNPYSGVLYTPHEEPYWSYDCESRADSSD